MFKWIKAIPRLPILGLVFLGGVAMGLTPAPINAWFLAWGALVPLWFFLFSAQDQTWKQAAILGLVWGIGYHGLALSWITGVHPMTWMGVPWLASLAIALFCWGFITLWGAGLVALWAGVLCLLNQRFRLNTLSRVFIGTTLWCGLEAFWSLGSLWWTSLSYTQSPHNLVILHLGQLSGATLVTAAIVSVNGLMAEVLFKGKTANVWFRLSPVILCALLHLIGTVLYLQPLETTNPLKVGIIQGNIPNDIKLFVDGKRRAIDNYTKGYLELANQGVEAVLTPEGALPFYLRTLKETPFYQAILDKNITAWVGAYGETGRSYTNSLFTITQNGEVFSRYDKVKLVPLGEFIPFEPIIGKLIDRLSPLEAHMISGKPDQTFVTPFGKAIVGICYESAFGEHFRRQTAAGGEFILTSSNNAHYSPSMPAQHHAQDVMRAIESDRWAVRATNTGYSGIVDPHGQTRWISGINTYEIYATEIDRRTTQTLYVQWGDWFLKLLLGMSGLSLLFHKLK